MQNVEHEHLKAINPEAKPSTLDGCEDCLREGTSWVHLRMCLTCGHIGCCDSSPEKHARKHWGHSVDSTEHPIIRSFEPGEDWVFCYPHAEIIPAYVVKEHLERTKR